MYPLNPHFRPAVCFVQSRITRRAAAHSAGPISPLGPLGPRGEPEQTVRELAEPAAEARATRGRSALNPWKSAPNPGRSARALRAVAGMRAAASPDDAVKAEVNHLRDVLVRKLRALSYRQAHGGVYDHPLYGI